MNNTIRCCISCILPCGSLDVIRIVHANGRVEEISGTILASEIMKANPKHVLKKHASPSYNNEGVAEYPKIMIISPNVELQRGKIYFLVPTPIPSTTKKTCPMPSSSTTSLKKRYYRRSGHVVVWKPHLKSISEATSYA